MAKTKISEFSATPANNTDIDNINIAEGCAPSGINNAIRELMAQLKEFQAGTAGDSFNGPIGTSTAAAGAFTTLSASGAFTYGGVTLSNAVTGTGNMVLSASPTLVTPTLGTPASVTLTNATGLPISTGVSGLGTGVATFLATPSSANLAAAVSDETGTGALVFANSPTFVNPALGTPASGTVTNLTGTASININGTVGATTANTGNFTTLTTSSTVTHNGGTANSVCFLNGSKVLTTGSTLTFDGSNLGLGVTPSAWGSVRNAIQLGHSGSVFSNNATGGINTNSINLGSNCYLTNSQFIYINTAAATYYNQFAGAHSWFTAPSGTAGNAISFTQALSLTAAGNLLLGGTTDPGGTKVLYIGNGTTPGTPTSGGVLYVESGALKYKGSSGTVTTLGAA